MAQTKEGALKTAAKWAGVSVEEYARRVSEGQNRCTRCKTWRLRADFGSDKSRPDGRDRVCHHCRRKVAPSTEHLFKPGQPSMFKGRRHSDEAKAKMAKVPRPNLHRVGQKHTEEVRARMSKIVRERTPRGENHYAYRHGATQRNLSLRRTPEYLVWRKAVFERDSYTCQDCGDRRGGNLRAHHDKPMGEFPELAYEVSNGVTLCHPCHELRHFKPDSIRNVRKLKRGERLWK